MRTNQHTFKLMGRMLNTNVMASVSPEILNSSNIHIYIIQHLTPVHKYVHKFELHFNGKGKLMTMNSLLVLMFYEASTLLSWPLLKLFAETSCPHLEL